MSAQRTSPPGRGEVLWEPTTERVDSSRLAAFATFARERGALGLGDGPGNEAPTYEQLHRASVERLGELWSTLADFFEVELEARGEALGSSRMPGAEWFPGARTSYAAHLIGRWSDDPERVAVIAAGEGPDAIREVSWAELEATAGAIAKALGRRGVGAGDFVASYMPNVPETVAMFLACASLGATWVSCSPDFGASAVADRLIQTRPRILFAVDGYVYGGRVFDRTETVAEISARLGEGTEIVRFPYLAGAGEGVFEGAEPPGDLPGATPWDRFLAEGEGGRLEPVTLPFDHPLWVLFSSGTTGLPKGLVHSQGGILLEHLKWLGLQGDLGAEDRLLWLTTTGWTMWNFVVGGLLTGTTIVLYEGNPAQPDLDTIWSIAERCGVTCLGAGAGFFHSCMSAGLRPRREHDLSKLRSLGSTGSPLLPEAFDWVYGEVGEDLWLFSTSGGTDICSAFVGGSPWLGVRRGELQAPALGVDVQAWGPEGDRLGPGEVGELVVTKPMPSMPLRLLGDSDGSRYVDSYFDVYPGVWRHGDWIEMTPSGGAVIHGRSDSTINRGGVRIGTAEIYRALLEFPGIADATVVETPEPDDGASLSEILLFVQLEGEARGGAGNAESGLPGGVLDDELVGSIRGAIRAACSPRHVPDRVIAAPAIPRTLTGKVIETPIKRLLEGVPAERALSRDSLADPEALDWFASWAETWRAESSRDPSTSASEADRPAG